MAEEVKIEVMQGIDDVYTESDSYEESVASEDNLDSSYAGDSDTTTTSSTDNNTTQTALPPQPITEENTTNATTQQTTQKQTKTTAQTKKVVKKVVKRPVVKKATRAPKVKVAPQQRFRIDWTSFFLGMGSAFVIYWGYRKLFKRGK